MEILLEYFGKIKKSIIKLDGLSLIAGQNDTGKSTVGKCLFALIKSIYNYEQLFFNITEQVMNSNFAEIITPFLREYNIDENLKKQLTELKYNIASNKNNIIIILLIGGDKSTQEKDIEKAKQLKRILEL